MMLMQRRCSDSNCTQLRHSLLLVQTPCTNSLTGPFPTSVKLMPRLRGDGRRTLQSHTSPGLSVSR